MFNYFNKKNTPLIIAFGLPIFMIIVLASFIYFPGIGKRAKVNFVYATGDNVSYSNTEGYIVKNGKLVKEEQVKDSDTQRVEFPKQLTSGNVQLYYYNVTSSQSNELTFEQAQEFKLDPSLDSPDGYVITQGGNGGNFIFGGGNVSYNDRYLRGFNRSFKLNLKLSGNFAYSNFQFLGWVE